MLEDDNLVNSKLKVNFSNITATINQLIEVNPQISKAKNPILH